MKIFQEFEEECKGKDWDVQLSTHLRNLIAVITDQSKFRAISSVNKRQFKEGWDKSKEGMRYAIGFLESNVRLDNSVLLTSPYLLTFLTYYGYRKNYRLDPEEARQLRRWVLIANTKARYSGSSESFLNQDLAAIRDAFSISMLFGFLASQFGRLNIEAGDLKNRKINSSYFKTMFLAFREDGALDWLNGLAISLNHSGSKNKLQHHHICLLYTSDAADE